MFEFQCFICFGNFVSEISTFRNMCSCFMISTTLSTTNHCNDYFMTKSKDPWIHYAIFSKYGSKVSHNDKYWLDYYYYFDKFGHDI